MKDRIAEALKWIIVIVFAGAVFYAVYPRWVVVVPGGNRTGLFKYNKITGECFVFGSKNPVKQENESEWQKIE